MFPTASPSVGSLFTGIGTGVLVTAKSRSRMPPVSRWLGKIRTIRCRQKRRGETPGRELHISTKPLSTKKADTAPAAAMVATFSASCGGAEE